MRFLLLIFTVFSSGVLYGQEHAEQNVRLERTKIGQFGWSALMDAAIEADLVRATQLLESGVEVDHKNQYGQTALMMAVSANSQALVNLLLSSGADPNILDVRETNSLGIAAVEQNIEIVSFLLKYNAQLPGYFHRRMAIEQAAVRGNYELASLFVRDGRIDPALKRGYYNALTTAANYGHLSVVRLLLDAGVPITQKRTPYAPLVVAAREGHIDVVRVILDAHSNIDHGEHEALSQAISRRHFKIAELLADHGSPVSAGDLAATLSVPATASALFTKVDLDQFDETELRSLLFAADVVNHEEILNRLLKREESVETSRFNLVFQRSDDDTHALYLWHPATDKTELLYVPTVTERPYVFVTPRQRTIFVLEGYSVFGLSIDDPTEFFKFELPNDLMRKQLEQIEEEWSQSKQANDLSSSIAAIGYAPTGEIAVLSKTRHLGEVIRAHLHIRRGDTWLLVDTRSCSRFESTCGVDGFDGVALNDWPDELSAWHPEIRRNDYFVGVDPTTDINDGRVIYFKDGVREWSVTVARYYSTHGDDIYGEIKSIQVGESIRKVPHNWHSSLAGKTLLVRDLQTGMVELIDISTGKTVLDSLSSARWIPVVGIRNTVPAPN